MTLGGTAHYEKHADLPPLVRSAVEAARRAGFEQSCLPEQGRLLQVLAGGARRIGETGTGYGVGLAWLASGAPPEARLFGIDRATAAEIRLTPTNATLVGTFVGHAERDSR